jgi:hypothetical protein
MTFLRLLIISGLCVVGLQSLGQGTLRQEAYRFDVTEFPPEVSLGQGTDMLVEDTLGQVWSSGGAHLLRLGPTRGELFATVGTNGFNANIVTKLFTDAAKHLWISTNNGLFHLNPRSQKITHHPISLDGKPLATQSVHHWGPYIFAVQGRNKLIRYHPASRRATHIKLPPGFGFISAISHTQRGRTFLADEKAIYEIKDSITLKRVCTIPAVGMPAEMEGIDDKWLFLSTVEGALVRIDLTRQQAAVVPGQDTLITNATSLSAATLLGHNYMVQCTNRSVVWTNVETLEQHYWGQNTLQRGYTLSGRIISNLQDRYGRIWIGLGERAVSLPPLLTPQKMYFISDAAANGWDPAKEKGPEAIAFDKATRHFVCGVDDTVVMLHADGNNAMQKIALGPNRNIDDLKLLPGKGWIAATEQGIWLISQGKATLLHDSLRAVSGIRLLVKADTIFIGTQANGLYVVHKNGTLLAHHSKASGLTGNYVAAMAVDKNGQFWFSNGRSGLYTLVAGQPKPMAYDKQNLGLPFLYDIVCDTDSNKLWLAGEGGFLCYDVAKGSTSHITPAVPNGIEFGIWRLYPKGNGRFLVATNGGKLFEWSSTQKKAVQIGVEKSWWGENMLNTSSFTQDDAGNWWGCFRTGVLQLAQNDFFEEKNLLPPQMRSLQVAHKPWQAHPAAYQNTPLQISYRQSPLTVVCSSVASQQQIQFILQGYDNQWHTGELATYTNLDGGNYTLKVRTANAVGNTSAEQVLQLKILPPWWKTWRFRVLAGLVLAGSIAGFVKRRIDLANKENSYKLRLAQSELKAIRSQMNPHFIFNCITAIDGLIARNERAKASEYLGKFSRLMRQVLQLSSNQFVSLGEDLDTLQLYLQLEQLRMEGGFTFTINADAELRQNLELPPLMLQPFAENAILHGLKPKADSNRQLHITISRQGQSIVCTIADNGIGRQAAAALQPAQPGHQSSGMRLTQERLQLLQDVLGYKTQFTVVDAPTDTGTVVTITLTKTSTTSD